VLQDLPFSLAKILLGGAFLVFGLNGFLKFLPVPLPSDPNAQAFLQSLMASKFMYVVKGLEVVGGMMILSGRLAPLGLLILGPIIVCIFLYDLLMDPKGLPLILVLMGLAGFVGYKHKDLFSQFFVVRHDQCTFVPEKTAEPK
jgi:putative oxidoreductase